MSGYTVEVTSKPTEFKAAAFDFLRRDPLRHTVVLSVVADRAAGHVGDTEPSHFVAVRDDSRVVGVAMRTVGRSIYLDELPLPAVDLVATEFAAVLPNA